MESDHVLVIGFVWPEPNSSAAGSRMMQLIQLFKEQAWKVTFACAAANSPYMADLAAIGVETKVIVLNSSGFDVFVKELQPSVVLFDRFMTEEQFGWRVAEQCPDALRILDTEDLHCLRYGRWLALKEQREFVKEDLFSNIAKREIASILRCDITLIISEFEMELLQDVFKVDATLLYYLPFLLEAIDKKVTASWPDHEKRNDFIFIGNFLHEPNWDAVLYLKKVIWPKVREQMPEAVLYVYGAYLSQKVLQMHHPKTGFYIMGRAANAQEVISHSKVMLAPLRFGAGIKGKLVEAMFCGTPSVTSVIGAEAMAIDTQWNGSIMDNADEFAAAAVQLYKNKILWHDAQQKGISIYNIRYLKSVFAMPFIHHIKQVANNLKQHRANNFTGSMLMHHTMTATKYMSRWIEEKNK
jgi:glycosyltransferase involved in cell wall biosynthesis